MDLTMLLRVLIVALLGSSIAASENHQESKPYAFGYSIQDGNGVQHKEESSDGGNNVKGSYGFTDDRGVHRVVDYVADNEGFRAHVKTNEPGTANQNPADVQVESSAHNAGPVQPLIADDLSVGFGGLRYGGLGFGAFSHVKEQGHRSVFSEALSVHGPLTHNLENPLSHGIEGSFLNGIQSPLSHGIQVPLSHGIQAPLSHGIQVPLSHGIQVPLSHGTQGSLSDGAQGPLSHGIEGPLSHGIQVPLTHGIQGPLSHATQSSLSNDITGPLAHGIEGPFSHGIQGPSIDGIQGPLSHGTEGSLPHGKLSQFHAPLIYESHQIQKSHGADLSALNNHLELNAKVNLGLAGLQFGYPYVGELGSSNFKHGLGLGKVGRFNGNTGFQYRNLRGMNKNAGGIYRNRLSMLRNLGPSFITGFPSLNYGYLDFLPTYYDSQIGPGINFEYDPFINADFIGYGL